jgi:hypothetical protein
MIISVSKMTNSKAKARPNFVVILKEPKRRYLVLGDCIKSILKKNSTTRPAFYSHVFRLFPILRPLSTSQRSGDPSAEDGLFLQAESYIDKPVSGHQKDRSGIIRRMLGLINGKMRSLAITGVLSHTYSFP